MPKEHKQQLPAENDKELLICNMHEGSCRCVSIGEIAEFLE